MILTDYGPFTSLVATVGMIVSATGAIIMGFRRGAKWEPVEIDVDHGPRRVASLITTVGIVIAFSQLQDPLYLSLLIKIAVSLGVSTLVFLVLYGFVTGLYSYNEEKVVNGQLRNDKIIGGLWLTPFAKRTIAQQNVTVQEFFKGTAYNRDRVWPRLSNALAKQIFVVCYIGLTASGSIALAFLAIIVGLKTRT